jgi:hypothetical protein
VNRPSTRRDLTAADLTRMSDRRAGDIDVPDHPTALHPRRADNRAGVHCAAPGCPVVLPVPQSHRDNLSASGWTCPDHRGGEAA